jgi:hypothetical protein
MTVLAKLFCIHDFLALNLESRNDIDVTGSTHNITKYLEIFHCNSPYKRWH